VISFLQRSVTIRWRLGTP